MYQITNWTVFARKKILTKINNFDKSEILV